MATSIVNEQAIMVKSGLRVIPDPDLSENQQEQLRQAAQRMMTDGIDKISPTEFATLQQRIHRELGDDLETYTYARSIDDQFMPVACQAGCNHCCHQPVGVFAHEVFAIMTWAKANLSAEIYDALIIRIKTTAILIRKAGPEGYLHAALKCPFNDDDGQCLVYPVRPLPCGAMSSYNVGRCKHARMHGNDFSLVQGLPRQAQAYESVGLGILAAYEDQGFDTQEIELVLACLTWLTDPEQAWQSWFIDRGDAFANAHWQDVVGSESSAGLDTNTSID